MPAYESMHCTIEFLEDCNAINIKWFGAPPSDEFRRACNRALEVMQEHNTGRFLTDNRKAKVFRVDDQKWLNEDWLPRATAAGYSTSAVLVSDKEIFTKFAARRIARERDKTKYHTAYFMDEEEARVWLCNQ